MPKTQKMIFSEPQDAEWPPYLLGFKGTPAERHAENLKVLTPKPTVPTDLTDFTYGRFFAK